jgi:hypothetical protein
VLGQRPIRVPSPRFAPIAFDVSIEFLQVPLPHQISGHRLVNIAPKRLIGSGFSLGDCAVGDTATLRHTIAPVLLISEDLLFLGRSSLLAHSRDDASVMRCANELPLARILRLDQLGELL